MARPVGCWRSMACAENSARFRRLYDARAYERRMHAERNSPACSPPYSYFALPPPLALTRQRLRRSARVRGRARGESKKSTRKPRNPYHSQLLLKRQFMFTSPQSDPGLVRGLFRACSGFVRPCPAFLRQLLNQAWTKLGQGKSNPGVGQKPIRMLPNR